MCGAQSLHRWLIGPVNRDASNISWNSAGLIIQIWEANPIATDDHYEDLTFSLLNICTQLRAFQSEQGNLIGISRSLSVELRKLLLDNPLLQRCVRRLELQPLIDPHQLRGDPVEDVLRLLASKLTITKMDEPNKGEKAM